VDGLGVFKTQALLMGLVDGVGVILFVKRGFFNDGRALDAL
jgi:hypothetical protein